jgi:dihydropteroate synthase
VLLFFIFSMNWQTSRFSIDLSRPKVMGIVNLTPDSFSDGGRFLQPAQALAQCERLLKEGADILDLGAESSRPGSGELPAQEELARLMPVLKEAVRLGVPVSVDTYKPVVMQSALDAGADILNDIWGFRRGQDASGQSALDVVAMHPSCGLCVMHMHGEPVSMQLSPMQGDALPAVLAFLQEQARQLHTLGVAQERIVLDPGVGFGKTVAQNFSLLARQSELLALGYGVLVGWSRKSSLGAVTGLQQAADRAVPSVVAAVLAVAGGAQVVRVHDVAATVAGLKVLYALHGQTAE